MTTRTWIVYGTNGHRQRVSFEPSAHYDWSEDGKTRVVELECRDKTGTNDYVRVIITRDTADECLREFEGQLSDGIFENASVGAIVEEVGQ